MQIQSFVSSYIFFKYNFIFTFTWYVYYIQDHCFIYKEKFQFLIIKLVKQASCVSPLDNRWQQSTPFLPKSINCIKSYKVLIHK